MSMIFIKNYNLRYFNSDTYMNGLWISVIKKSKMKSFVMHFCFYSNKEYRKVAIEGVIINVVSRFNDLS